MSFKDLLIRQKEVVMKKLIVSMFFGLCFAFAAIDAAFASSVMDNAVRLFEVEKNYTMTIMVIDKGFLENKISDDERSKAYQMQGYAYRELGYHSESREAFDKAIATGMVGYRENQWILLLNADHILAKKEEIKLYISSKGASGKAVVADIAQLAHNNLASGNLEDAEKLFDFLVELENEYKTKAFSGFFEKGKTQKGNEAEKCADKAAKYASTQEAKEKAGKLYLKAATEIWPNEDYVAVKNKAVPLVGIEFVKAVFPGEKSIIVFEKTYNKSDVNLDDNVTTFKWSETVRVGDYVEIIGIIPPGAEPIYMWKGKNYNPGWQPIEKGNFGFTVKIVPTKGTLDIWIDHKNGVKATVKVTRTINEKPNTNILANI